MIKKFHPISSYYSDGHNFEESRNDIIEETPSDSHVCKKSLQMEIQLIKANETITKLQRRCAEKTEQLNRLKASEKRCRLAKKNLEEILREFKEKKWVSDEGQQILNVNNYN